MSLDYLKNPTDSRVQAALQRACTICGARKGERCRFGTGVVHMWRLDEPGRKERSSQ